MTIRIFNYPTSKRLILLVIGDLLIVNGSIFLSAIIRLGFDPGCDYVINNLLSFVLTGLTFILTFFFMELYDIRKDFKSIGNVMTIAFATVSAFVVTTFLFYVTWYLRIGRGVFVINGLLVTFFIIGWRILYSYLLEQSMLRKIKTL